MLAPSYVSALLVSILFGKGLFVCVSESKREVFHVDYHNGQDEARILELHQGFPDECVGLKYLNHSESQEDLPHPYTNPASKL